jgi:hypothetical protein
MKCLCWPPPIRTAGGHIPCLTLHSAIKNDDDLKKKRPMTWQPRRAFRNWQTDRHTDEIMVGLTSLTGGGITCHSNALMLRQPVTINLWTSRNVLMSTIPWQ